MPIIYLVALVCLVIVATILNLLTDFNVIKNAKFARIINIITFAAAYFMLFLFVVVTTQVAMFRYPILGWGSIANLVLGFVAGTLVVVNSKVFKRK